MGDVDDRRALGLELSDDGEQPRFLARRERRGRFVEDENARVAGERARDLDHLAVAHAELFDRVLWTEPAPEPVEERLRAGGHGGGVDEAGAPRKIFDEHVLRHRHRREQRELLMDESDAVGARVARRGNARHAARNTNLSALGCDDSSENVHQRALARAVRAHERVGFARLNGKMGVLERADAGEGLRDAGHLEGGPNHREALPEMRSIQMNRMIAIPFTTRFMK